MIFHNFNLSRRPVRLLLFTALVLGSVGCQKKSPSSPSSDESGSGEKLPSGIHEGVTFLNDGTTAVFELFAPHKKSVYLIGDFNGWQKDAADAMHKTPDGKRWWIKINHLDPADSYGYQYLIDDTLRVADPYAHLVLDPDNDQYIPKDVYPDLKPYPQGKTSGIVSVARAHPKQYSWKMTHFDRPRPQNLVIYELLVRDFVQDHSYKTLLDTLNYISRLGVNAIELLPVNEFEGNDSWGYNSNFMLALDKYYGTSYDYKKFIDACHKRGIAVIQDIVLEDQFGSSPMVRMYATSSGSPSADNPWFDTENRHPYAVGYQLDHERPATVRYVENVLKYWMTEYHIDGYRFDQSKGFTQKRSTDDGQWSAYDQSRIDILEKYNDFITNIDPDFYVILEHFAEDKEEAALTSQGMMVWNNLSYAAQQSAMGYKEGWDLSRLFYDQHGFQNPDGLISYFESHDEERIQFKNEAYGNSTGGYDVKNLVTGLNRDALLSVFLFSVPGPKMFWQFGERGYDVSIDKNGRLGDKPPHWQDMENPHRKALYHKYAEMIRMKTHNAVFTTTDFDYNLSGSVKWIALHGNHDMEVEAVGNFDVKTRSKALYFSRKGWWVDNLHKDSIKVTSIPQKIMLKPGEYHLYSTRKLKK